MARAWGFRGKGGGCQVEKNKKSESIVGATCQWNHIIKGWCSAAQTIHVSRTHLQRFVTTEMK